MTLLISFFNEWISLWWWTRSVLGTKRLPWIRGRFPFLDLMTQDPISMTQDNIEWRITSYKWRVISQTMAYSGWRLEDRCAWGYFFDRINRISWIFFIFSFLLPSMKTRQEKNHKRSAQIYWTKHCPTWEMQVMSSDRVSELFFPRRAVVFCFRSSQPEAKRKINLRTLWLERICLRQIKRAVNKTLSLTRLDQLGPSGPSGKV